MRKLVLFLMLGGLASCATQAPNPWETIETETDPAVTPLDCGKWPMPAESSDAMIVYDIAGVNALDAYKTCSEANAEIALENARAVDQLKIARKGLTEAGSHQRSIADMRLTMLEDERRHNFFSKIGYWVVIIGMGVAL